MSQDAQEGRTGGVGGCPKSGPWEEKMAEHLGESLHCLRRPLRGRDTPGWQEGVSWRVLGQGQGGSPSADCPPHTDSFGIRLVPQASEDKFDCYKCHWREGSMCGYGICE